MRAVTRGHEAVVSAGTCAWFLTGRWFDAGPGALGDEGTLGLDAVVELPQPVAVLVDGEPRHHPDHFAQEVDHRADIEELGAQRLRAQVGDLQAGGLGGDAGVVGVAPAPQTRGTVRAPRSARPDLVVGFRWKLREPFPYAGHVSIAR